jgi:ATP-dependent RNA helicase SUPV3L1/SUV3
MQRSLPAHLRARGVTAVLGPTNTGKTHLAIERLVAHSSGIIGLPLRLLAREVYNRVVEKVGPEQVALITGEEKIKPDRARYWIATVEAMPRDLDVAFVAIDEIQLASDLDRGHVFTDRLLNHRGREETLLIGSLTMKPLIEALIPGVYVVTRPRLSSLSFAGDKKISRLPTRSAIVAFSAEEVYAIAELIRRHRGGAAVVLGALSPRTRNAQVALFEAGEVDYLVATDAIGMGLNLDVHHVAFAARYKYDGFQFRDLNAAELGQIAGRAGRHMRDGTFGSTGRCEPFDPGLVDAVENHRFDPVRILQWRNRDLDLRTLTGLLATLGEVPAEPGLTRALVADDEAALVILAREEEPKRLASTPDAVRRLWEVCSLPDYRRISPAGHADLVGGIFAFLMKDGRVPADWFARHLAMVDRTEGDIDTLSQRLAHVRTWSFVANRPDWLADPEHWQGVTRRIEDSLSDALHERLAARFVDRRTSVLMRRLREKASMEAEITASGEVTVEGQHVGQLLGFSFVPDPAAEGTEAKAALRNAASQALAGEIEGRAERFASAADSSLVLSNDGTVRWTGNPVAKLDAGDHIYRPNLRILADEQLTGPARDKVEARLKAWLSAQVVRLLGPAQELETAADLTGLARGIAFRLSESLGILERSKVAQDLKSLDQPGRAALRAKGVRFGAYHVYMPALVKPGPRILAAQLWALRNGGLEQRGIDEIAHLAGSGRTSFPVEPDIARGLYLAAGFRAFPTRAVRVDILERLADLIRPAIAYRPGTTPGDPPPGAADDEGFVQTGAMTSLVGTSGEGFAEILKSLGYAAETREGPAITVPLVPARPKPAPAAPAVAAPAAEPTEAAVSSETASGDAAADEAPVGDVIEVGALAAADEPDPTVQDEDSPVGQAEQESALLTDPTPDEIAEAAPALDEPTLEPAISEPAPSQEETASDQEDAGELAPTPDVAAAEDTAPDADSTVPISDQDAASLDLEAAAPEGSESPSGTSEGSAGNVTSPLPDAEKAVEGAPASLETPSREASHDEDVGGPESAPEAPAEPPVTIQIWRLQRFRREQHPRSRDHRRGDRSRGDPRAADSQPSGAPGQDAQRREGGRPPRPAAGPGGAFGRDRSAGGKRPPGGEGRPGGPRPERGRGRDERPRFEGRPERRERQPDPDSPFAKLAALKAQLEGRKDGQ